MKSIFILGASRLQVPAIMKAKEKGLYVYVLDYDPERKELLSYAYDPQKNDLYYYPGLFREYTVSELIDIGNAQLAGYSTAGKEGEQK